MMEVAQAGTISKIHIRAANANIAMVLCCVSVIASIPKNDVGTKKRNRVTKRTIGSPISFL